MSCVLQSAASCTVHHADDADLMPFPVPAGLRHPELRSAAIAPVPGAARCADELQPKALKPA